MLVRRILLSAALLIVIAFGALASSSPASAANPATANIGIDHNGGALNINGGPALVVEGGSVDVRLISQAASPGLGAWQINVQFDTDVVDATGCVAGPAASNVCNWDDPFGIEDIVRLAGADIGGVSGTANLMSMTLHALGPAGSCSALTIEVEILVDLTPLPSPPLDITPIISNGQICVMSCADITGDGFVGVRDVVRLLVHILRGRPYDAALDLNSDGVVSAADLQLALRQLGTSC